MYLHYWHGSNFTQNLQCVHLLILQKKWIKQSVMVIRIVSKFFFLKIENMPKNYCHFLLNRRVKGLRNSLIEKQMFSRQFKNVGIVHFHVHYKIFRPKKHVKFEN